MAWGSTNRDCRVLTYAGAGLGVAGWVPKLLKALGWPATELECPLLPLFPPVTRVLAPPAEGRVP